MMARLTVEHVSTGFSVNVGFGDFLAHVEHTAAALESI